MSTLTYTSVLGVQTCCNCGMTFGVEKSWDEKRRRDHKSFCCPAGHWQSYTAKSDIEKMREQRDAARRGRASAEGKASRARDEAEFQKRSAAAAKGQVTRIKNRLKNGICPHCNRHFENLARHMKSKHSEPQAMSRPAKDGETDG